jgi:hypothetical protein
MICWTCCIERGKEKYIPNIGGKFLGKQSQRMLKKTWEDVKKDIKEKNCDDWNWM